MAVNLPCLRGSCPNFLRTTYPYTECQPSSQTGSCPTVTLPLATALVCCWFITDRTLLSAALINQWTRYRHCYVLPVGTDAAIPATSSFTGSFSRTLPSRRSFTVVRQGSGRNGSADHSFLCCLYCHWNWMFDILQHLYWIILLTCPQDREDDSQDLTGNHYQRLHLL